MPMVDVRPGVGEAGAARVKEGKQAGQGVEHAVQLTTTGATGEQEK